MRRDRTERVPATRPLPRSFYERPAIDVAQALLGKIVTLGQASGRIVETEAYLSTGDDAAHSARGITDRTRVIFGPPGHAYVYLIYGMYECLNIVAEPEGTAGCVLIRALEPVSGITGLTNGPGKLTRALGITRQQNGADVTKGPLLVCEPGEDARFEIDVSPRIGISKSVDLPLRFYVKGNKFVSRETKKRS
jgi:DNA-3-methyladenine glycosylase